MAKIEGTQSIPASDLFAYKGNLTEAMPNNVVRKRYPFRIPTLQNGGWKVSEAQATNRAKFSTIASNFANVINLDRSRWFSNPGQSPAPDWYFNFFIMSGFLDVLGHFEYGCAMIKQIQNYFFELPTGGTLINLTSAVNPLRCFVTILGEGHFADIEQTDTVQAWYMVGIKPILNNLFYSSFSVQFCWPPDYPANIAVQIIEYL